MRARRAQFTLIDIFTLRCINDVQLHSLGARAIEAEYEQRIEIVAQEPISSPHRVALYSPANVVRAKMTAWLVEALILVDTFRSVF